MAMSLFDDPYADDPQVPYAPEAPPPSLPVPKDESGWERGGKWAGLLSGIGATLGATSAGWRGQPYSGQVSDMFAGMRARRGQERFQRYAKQMAGYVPQGSREADLWQAVASGSPEMQRLLPSLWSAQAYDQRRGSEGALSIAHQRYNANIDSMRGRYIRGGVGIMDLITDGLANKDSELRKAMEHKYGETPAEAAETERFRRWALYMNDLKRIGQPPIPYDQFGWRGDGTLGPIQVEAVPEGEVPPPQGGGEEEETSLLGKVGEKAKEGVETVKGWFGAGDGEGSGALTGEEALAAHLGQASGAPSGRTPPMAPPGVASEPMRAPARGNLLDYDLLDAAGVLPSRDSRKTSKSLEAGRRKRAEPFTALDASVGRLRSRLANPTRTEGAMAGTAKAPPLMEFASVLGNAATLPSLRQDLGQLSWPEALTPDPLSHAYAHADRVNEFTDSLFSYAEPTLDAITNSLLNFEPKYDALESWDRVTGQSWNPETGKYDRHYRER